MDEFDRQAREAVLDRTMETVEMKHFNPEFDRPRWRRLVNECREAIVTSASRLDFESSLAKLIRRVSTPDSGLIHESERRSIPKGVAARFQYCQPNECAPGVARGSAGGDVMIAQLGDRTGWLKVTKFPGAVGIDIANQIDNGIRVLSGCTRLIVDLRGNAGGGLAFLRVMSYLTPERVPVGYSITRACAERKYSKESLPVFDWIPSRKIALAWLALKFGLRDDSVSIFTEKLGARAFQGKAVLLVDGETTGAGERIAAFARERSLAPIVGTRTAGRLICCSSYKVGHGYFVRIPARAWYTWSGELLEDKGVQPDFVLENRADAQLDAQLEHAMEVVRAL